MPDVPHLKLMACFLTTSGCAYIGIVPLISWTARRYRQSPKASHCLRLDKHTCSSTNSKLMKGGAAHERQGDCKACESFPHFDGVT